MDVAPHISAAASVTKNHVGVGIDTKGPEWPAHIPPFGHAKNPSLWDVCRPIGCSKTIVGPFRPPILGCFVVLLPPAPSAPTGDQVSFLGVVGVRTAVGVRTTIGALKLVRRSSPLSAKTNFVYPYETESGVGNNHRVPIRRARILPLGHAAKTSMEYVTSRDRTGRELVSDHMVYL